MKLKIKGQPDPTEPILEVSLKSTTLGNVELLIGNVDSTAFSWVLVRINTNGVVELNHASLRNFGLTLKENG